MGSKLSLQKDEILVLRNCKADGTSYGGFKWPQSGYIECPDWQDTDQCGNGLHGLPWGVGSVEYFYNEPAVWIVFKTKTTPGSYRHGSGSFTNKCKSKGATVVHYGSKQEALDLIAAHSPQGLAMVYSTQTAGGGSTQTAGDYSTQTAGDYSTQKAGYGSVQVSIYWQDGKLKTSCRVVADEDADQWCQVSGGAWRRCTEREAEEAEAKLKGGAQ